MQGCFGAVRTALIVLIGGAVAIAVVLSFWFSTRPPEAQPVDGKAAEVAAQAQPDVVDQQERDELWVIHMESKVRERLKDPDSAKFRKSQTFHGGGVPVVCGEVNSKNSFGGMGGFQRFVAAGEIIALDEQVEGGIQQVWDQFCRN